MQLELWSYDCFTSRLPVAKADTENQLMAKRLNNKGVATCILTSQVQYRASLSVSQNSQQKEPYKWRLSFAAVPD